MRLIPTWVVYIKTPNLRNLGAKQSVVDLPAMGEELSVANVLPGRRFQSRNLDNLEKLSSILLEKN